MELLDIIPACQVMMHLFFVKVHFYLLLTSMSSLLISFPCIASNFKPANCTTGELRLVGGSEIYEGRLEVCINQLWGSVCRSSFSTSDIQVACRDLGYQRYGESIITFLIRYLNNHFLHNRWNQLW